MSFTPIRKTASLGRSDTTKSRNRIRCPYDDWPSRPALFTHASGHVEASRRARTSVHVLPSERNRHSVVLPPIVTRVRRREKSRGGSGPRNPSAFLVCDVIGSSLVVCSCENEYF
jgi:hypothetical protein